MASGPASFARVVLAHFSGVLRDMGMGDAMERLGRSVSTFVAPQGAGAARCPGLGTGLGGVHVIRVLLMIPFIFALLFAWVLRDVYLDRSFFSSPVPLMSTDMRACMPNLVRAVGWVATLLSHVLEAYRRRKLPLAGAPATRRAALRSPHAALRSSHAAPRAHTPRRTPRAPCLSRSSAQAVGATEPSDATKPGLLRGCFSLRLNAGSMAVWDTFDCVETTAIALCCSGGHLVDLYYQHVCPQGSNPAD